MTTVKINNQQDLESAINAVAERLDDIIPFGKFANWSIEDVPNYYLTWLISEEYLENNSYYNYLLKPVEDEVKYRETFNVFISGEE